MNDGGQNVRCRRSRTNTAKSTSGGTVRSSSPSRSLDLDRIRGDPRSLPVRSVGEEVDPVSGSPDSGPDLKGDKKGKSGDSNVILSGET